MKRIITDIEREMLDNGVAFQVLDNTYIKEGNKVLHDSVAEEGRSKHHRSWYVFSPTKTKGNEGVVAKTLYELFHKEAYLQGLYVKEVMMVDLLKMGNKKRYEISSGYDFITIPDFFKSIYAINYKGIEAPSVLRWMGYVTGKYGVGFVLYVDNVEEVDEFFGGSFFSYYTKYLTITTVDDE